MADVQLFNPQLTEDLVAKYPKIFAYYTGVITPERGIFNEELGIYEYQDFFGAPIVERGIECSSNWYDLLDKLFSAIQTYLDEQEAAGNPVPQVLAVQVKRKFKRLRFYYDGGDEFVEQLVLQAELESENTPV